MISVLNKFDLKDQVAIITGGSEWLGYDMGCALAEAGAFIVITSRQLERARQACQKISDTYKVETLPIVLDQRDYKSVENMTNEILSWKGHINILINNAGGGSGKSEGNIFSRCPEDIKNLIDINLTGPLFCCKAVAAQMMSQKSGKIINIASIAALVGRDRRMYHKNAKMEQPIDYAAAKAGIIGMTQDLAGFLAPYGICVNAISPGGFDKGDLPDGFVQDYSNATMLGRMGMMGSDIKGAALFLASSASDYITGQNLVVDGGFSKWK